MQIIPVILSGISGVALWPLLHKQYSKQYLPLTADNAEHNLDFIRLEKQAFESSPGDSIQRNKSYWSDGLACEMAKLWERGNF